MFFNNKIDFEKEIKNIQSLVAQNKSQKAQKNLEKILKRKDFPQDKNLEAARIYYSINLYKNSYELYQKAIDNISKQDLASLIDITNSLKLDEECRNFCNDFLKIEPSNLKVLDILLQKEIEGNCLYSALETIDKILAVQKNISDFNKIKLLKANIYYDLKEYDNSETVTLELLATEENNAKYLSQLANIYREKGMTNELLTVLNKLYAIDKQIQTAREIASILFKQKQYDEVEKFILSCEETDFLIKKILIQTNIKQQKYNAALERINAFLINDSKNFDFYKLKAEILIKKQQFKSAIDLLQNSVDFVDTVYLEEINSLLKNAHISFSKYLLSKKNYEQAFAVLEDTAKYGTDDDVIYYTIAKCNYEIFDFKKALLNLSKTIEINPANSDAYELMSEIYLKNDNLEQAIYYRLEAVKINPSNIYSLIKLGFLYTQNGQFDIAITFFKKALYIKEDISELNYNLALCYHKLHEKEEAKKYYERALELDNTNSNAQKNLDILKNEL